MLLPYMIEPMGLVNATSEAITISEAQELVSIVYRKRNIENGVVYTIHIIPQIWRLEILSRNAANQPLGDAVFHLYEEVAAGTIDAIQTSDGIWVLPMLNAAGMPIEAISGSDGVALIQGVSGVLWLKQVVPPVGYRVVNPWMQIHVTESYAIREVVDGELVYTVHVTIFHDSSSSGWRLPD